MPKRKVHRCPCEKYRSEASSSEKIQHPQINHLVRPLDEQQRRWYVAVKANRFGESGVSLLAQITGLVGMEWAGPYPTAFTI